MHVIKRPADDQHVINLPIHAAVVLQRQSVR